MRESTEIKPSLLWQARWKACLGVAMSWVKGPEGGGFNCMDGPSWRWQGLINKHRGLQKQSPSCSTQTMRQKVGQGRMKSWLETSNIIPALEPPEMSSVGSGDRYSTGKMERCCSGKFIYPWEYCLLVSSGKAMRCMNHGLISRLLKIILS